MLIRIKNLRLRTIIGLTDLERKDRQDVVVNAEIEFDGAQAARTDDIADGINYRTITKRLIHEVEGSDWRLLEQLADHILTAIMDEERVRRATVEVDKPHALRFADSVSVVCSAERGKT